MAKQYNTVCQTQSKWKNKKSLENRQYYYHCVEITKEY